MIFPLVDNWNWWGGVADYAAFRGQPREAFWTDPRLIADFQDTVRFVLTRRNTVSGVPYKDDKAILCWELGNELWTVPYEVFAPWQSDRLRKHTRPRFLKLLASIFEQGIREGSFRPHDAAHTGRMFLGGVTELFELQADGASNEEVNEYAGAMIDVLLHGFSIHVGMPVRRALPA